MEALPTEILDLIMLEIERLEMPSLGPLGSLRPLRLYPSRSTTFENPRGSHDLTRSPGFQALTMLRLVSKSICSSASRSFFRNLGLTVGRRDNGSQSLMKLEDFSNGPWATDVRKLDIRFSSAFIEGMGRHPVEFRDFFERLRSLFMKLPNLEAFGLYPCVYYRRYEAFINVAVNTIGCLSLLSLTELEISRDYYSDYYSLEEFLSMETDSGTPRGGLKNLRYLGLEGHFTWEKIVNLLQYYLPGKLPGTLHLINPRRLRYLQLEYVDITANQLFYLLKNSKESIRYIDITASLRRGSWLQVLFKIMRALNLLEFRFDLPHIPRANPSEIEGLEHGLLQNIRDEKILCVYAHSDIQRQVNANRLAAGLIPLQGNVDVERPFLKCVMEEAYYRELCSLPEL